MNAWILLLDNHHGRLLEVRSTAAGRFHIDERATIEDEPESEDGEGRLRQRLSPRSDRMGMAATDWQGQETEHRHRFGKRVAAWVDSQLRERSLEHALLFCAPRMLGLVRQELPAATAARLDLRKGDLMQLSHAELLEHKVVREALAALPTS